MKINHDYSLVIKEATIHSYCLQLIKRDSRESTLTRDLKKSKLQEQQQKKGSIGKKRNLRVNMIK